MVLLACVPDWRCEVGWLGVRGAPDRWDGRAGRVCRAPAALVGWRVLELVARSDWSGGSGGGGVGSPCPGCALCGRVPSQSSSTTVVAAVFAAFVGLPTCRSSRPGDASV